MFMVSVFIHLFFKRSLTCKYFSCTVFDKKKKKRKEKKKIALLISGQTIWAFCIANFMTFWNAIKIL